jgi:phosphotransferase system enzyme I (PtsI)
VRAELRELSRSVPASAPTELGAFLNLHLMILDDSTLSQAPRDLIRTMRCNAVWALVTQMDHLVAQFEKIEDAYLRERKADVVQVVERVLKALMHQPGRASAPSHEERLIVVAHDLSPADMILFKQHQYAGFVTDLGGVTSHTAIVARSLNIPAIVGAHSARQMVREGELVIVDGVNGVLIVAPISSMLTVPSDEMPNMVPNFSAAFATARSPSWCNNRCSAVGAQNSGIFSF